MAAHRDTAGNREFRYTSNSNRKVGKQWRWDEGTTLFRGPHDDSSLAWTRQSQWHAYTHQRISSRHSKFPTQSHFLEQRWGILSKVSLHFVFQVQRNFKSLQVQMQGPHVYWILDCFSFYGACLVLFCFVLFCLFCFCEPKAKWIQWMHLKSSQNIKLDSWKCRQYKQWKALCNWNEKFGPAREQSIQIEYPAQNSGENLTDKRLPA